MDVCRKHWRFPPTAGILIALSLIPLVLLVLGLSRVVTDESRMFNASFLCSQAFCASMLMYSGLTKIKRSVQEGDCELTFSAPRAGFKDDVQPVVIPAKGLPNFTMIGVILLLAVATLSFGWFADGPRGLILGLLGVAILYLGTPMTRSGGNAIVVNEHGVTAQGFFRRRVTPWDRIHALKFERRTDQAMGEKQGFCARLILAGGRNVYIVGELDIQYSAQSLVTELDSYFQETQSVQLGGKELHPWFSAAA